MSPDKTLSVDMLKILGGSLIYQGSPGGTLILDSALVVCRSWHTDQCVLKGGFKGIYALYHDLNQINASIIQPLLMWCIFRFHLEQEYREYNFSIV